MKPKSQQSVKTNSATKKIGFLSVVLLVIGSALGAGILFKNKEVLNNNHGSFIFSLVC
jgi:amino acid transporter